MTLSVRCAVLWDFNDAHWCRNSCQIVTYHSQSSVWSMVNVVYVFVSLPFHVNWTTQTWDMVWHPKEAKAWRTRAWNSRFVKDSNFWIWDKVNPQHASGSWLIRSGNMKKIRLVLVLGGNDSGRRRTDGPPPPQTHPHHPPHIYSRGIKIYFNTMTLYVGLGTQPIDHIIWLNCTHRVFEVY